MRGTTGWLWDNGLLDTRKGSQKWEQEVNPPFRLNEEKHPDGDTTDQPVGTENHCGKVTEVGCTFGRFLRIRVSFLAGDFCVSFMWCEEGIQDRARVQF